MVSAPIVERLKEHLPAILQDRPVLLAYLYGSVAAGCPTPQSDIDIALVLTPQAQLSAYARFKMEMAIAAEIEQRCQIYDVDVRSISAAPLRVQGQVVTRGVLIYARDEQSRVKYEVQTRKHYFDFLPVLTLMRQAYFARLEADREERNV